MSNIWFDNGTDTYFQKGDRVVWLNAEEETEGILKSIDVDSFSVEWDDGLLMRYEATSLDAIKKFN